MKKIILLSVVGLLLGLGGAIGIVVVREKQARAAAPPPVADSAAVDSLASDSTHVAHGAGDSLGIDSARVAALADSAAAIASTPGWDSTAAPAGDTLAAADSANPSPSPATEPPTRGEERLARIFAAMRPEEAARVLEQMSDPEVRRLLSHLRERQAAAIMSSISPERAAVISSAVIRGERSTP